MLLAFVAAGCARERPSALSIRNCLRDHGVADVELTSVHGAPPGVHDDWTGTQLVTGAYRVRVPDTSRTAFAGEAVLVAPSDAEARRIATAYARLGAPVAPRGSVLVFGNLRRVLPCL